MKKTIFHLLSLFVFLALTMALPSCKDKWNKHYKDEAEEASSMRIADYIQSKAELSKFSEMLTIAGYDTILNASQTYTVWAPTNDALQNIDLNDKELVKSVVKNHIARFSYPTSGITSDSLHMINGKIIRFFLDNSGIHFGNCSVANANILTANGIIHTLNGYVPYQENIYEYILRTPGLDSLKAYISQIKKVFDKDHSTALSIDQNGNTVYDSAFIISNVILDKIGHLDAEDSVYSAILPNNTAWNEAYNRIKQYFIPNIDNPVITPAIAASVQRDSTCFTIVKDMVFKTRVTNPSALDSLRSTTGNIFHQASDLFNNTTGREVSNGIVYVTSKMPYKSDTWLKVIKIEAERSYNRTNLNSNIYLNYSFGSSLEVSRYAYIKVEPTTTASPSVSKVYVDFSIPYPLSGKYNIYCVFVPASITNVNDLLPYRAVFSLLTYWDVGNKKWSSSQSISVTNNTTDPNGMTKMLVAKDYQFPCFDPDLGENHPYFGLRVQNDVAVSETTLSRTMRIDCVILEPVYE